jgi:hypothetical protein
MENRTDYFEDLKVIKRVMEESSRFLSLSGLSGLFAGIIALAGAGVAVYLLPGGNRLIPGYNSVSLTGAETSSLRIALSLVAFIVLILALGIAVWFSYRKSVKKGLKMWTPVSKRMLINLFVPLVTGGILILIFISQHNWLLLVPSMLIFYGLGLVNAGKFTYNEIFWLGNTEILTGLIAAILPSAGLLFWCIGFGVLHIVYGLAMYRKYER